MSQDDDLYSTVGLDSIQTITLIMVIETMADAMVPPAALPELFTLQDCYDYYVALMRETSAP